MGLMKWLKGPYSDDEYDEYDDYREEEDTGRRRERSREEDREEQPRESRVTASDWQAPAAEPLSAFSLGGLASGRTGGYGGQNQLAVVKAKGFEDAGGIADHLIAGRAVLLDLESAAPALKRRLLDFLSGVAYTSGGQIQPASSATYLITPPGVTVMQGVRDSGRMSEQPEGESFKWAL